MNFSKLKYWIIALSCFYCEFGYGQQDSIVKVIKLDEAINLGIQNNRSLKIANANVAIANENTDQAKISKMPKIGLNGGFTYIGDPKLYEGFYENKLNVDYYNQQAYASLVGAIPIYNGSLISNRIEQQELLTRMEEAAAKMTEAEVKIRITEQYFTLEKLYKQIEVTKQNIINTDIRINQLKSRVANGQNLRSDLLRTELQQSNFKVSVFRNANTIVLISNYLDILTGLPTNLVLKPDGTDIIIPTERINLENSVSQAYLNRMEIKQAEIGVQLSESSLDMTKAGFRPNLNASVMLNTQYPAQWPNYINIINYWGVGLSLNWDISGFYNIKHKVSSDKLKIEKSNIALDATKDQIEQDVKAAYVRFLESKENIVTYKKNVELSQSNYRIVKSSYDNDFALISDMVDAELQLNEAKISLVNANLDLVIQYYFLQYAMGAL